MWLNSQTDASIVRSHASRFGAADWQTCALALLSSVLLEIAAADGQPQAICIAMSVGVQAVLLVAAHLGCRRWARSRTPTAEAPSDVLIPSIFALGALPFVIDGVARIAFQTGWAFELTLLAFMRNLVLACAAAAVWPTYRQSATGLSVLLVIFASSVGNDRAMVVLLALYAIVGMWWLMGMYWGRLSDHLDATSERSMPRRWLVLIPVFVLLLALGITSQAPQRTAAAFAGIAPTSGGTQWHDEFARGGIGDGDALVKGTQDASSFGPVESDQFLDSEDTSLYDAFNDTYGEPLRTPKNSRAVALPASLVKEAQERMAKAKQANREFSTVRQTKTQRRELHDVESAAVLYVSGRGPLHLRLETFDLFDGEDWYPTESATSSSPALRLTERQGKPWIAMDDWAPPSDVYEGGEQHVLKLISLKSDRLPLPTNGVAFHIDRVDRPDLFQWAQESVVRLNTEENVPALTVLHSFSRVVDRSKLRRMAESEFMGRSERIAPLPLDAETQVMGQLAEQWAGHLPRDWSRVEAVVNQLRSDYVHDRNHTAIESGSGSNRIAQFVLHDKRGPDFLFASAASLMLRSLGYSTRLASGFYVDPSKYDAKRRHITVTTDDVHFWCEVYVGARTWIPIEPTPGYELLAPPLSLWARCELLARSLAAWSVTHAFELSGIAIFVVTLWLLRWRVIDTAYQVRLMWCHRSPRDRVLQVHDLLLRRSQWLGQPKPAWMSSREWYATTLRHAATDVTQTIANSRDANTESIELPGRSGDSDCHWSECELLRRWSRSVDWACFAPEMVKEPDGVVPLSEEIVRRWSLKRLAQKSK